MNYDIDYALITFINSKPEGNELRDIAIRTLADNRRKNEVAYSPPIRPRSHSNLSTPAKSLFLQQKCRRILPSIKYDRIKACGHNYKSYG